MNNYTVPLKTRVVAFFSAVVMSVAVLGATVLSMQAGQPDDLLQVMALDRVVITAPAVN